MLTLCHPHALGRVMTQGGGCEIIGHIKSRYIVDENKSKALAAALSQIEKQFGKGSIMRLGESEVAKDIRAISTGSLGLDLALGIGGLPQGRVVGVYRPGSSGENPLALSVVAQMP